MEEKQYPPYEEENSMVSEPVVARRHRSVRHGLTPTQLQLLKFFSYDDSEETAKEIQTVVFNHMQKRMDDELNRMWDEGILDQKRLDEIRQMHIRDVLK